MTVDRNDDNKQEMEKLVTAIDIRDNHGRQYQYNDAQLP